MKYLAALVLISATQAFAASDSALETLSVNAAQMVQGMPGLEMVADDSASFIMNEGENPSALLSSLMDQMRSSTSVRDMNESLSDLDIARAILNETEKEIL